MIGFYHENESYGCLSNWYPAEFDYAGKHYVHTEQFMMFQKVQMFRKWDLADQIMQTTDPAECKAIAGQRFPEFDSATWNKTCYTVVKRGIKAKFAQNPDILEVLLGTGNELLAECSLKDEKWGIGIDINDPYRSDVSRWKGQNLQGRILMEVREELRLDKLLSPNGRLTCTDACDLEPIPEWRKTAGELVHMPQFHDTIRAYSCTLNSAFTKDFFILKTLSANGRQP